MKVNIYAAWLIVVTLLSCTYGCGRKRTKSDVITPPSIELADVSVDPKLSGRMRGYGELNDILASRVAREPMGFDVGYRLRRMDPSKDNAQSLDEIFTGRSLIELLGAYSGNGMNSEPKNSAPNAVNMLLWYNVFDTLADDLSDACVSGPRVSKFRDDVLAAARGICGITSATVDGTERVMALWRALLMYDVPDREFDAFMYFFRHDLRDKFADKALLRQTIVSMLYQPELLIKD